MGASTSFGVANANLEISHFRSPDDGPTTMGMWIYFNATGTTMGMCDQKSGTYWMRANSNTTIISSVEGGSSVTSTNTVGSGSWNFYSTGWNGTSGAELAVWKDGSKEVIDGSITPDNAPTESLWLGTRNGGAADLLNGDIGNTVFNDFYMTDAEVVETMYKLEGYPKGVLCNITCMDETSTHRDLSGNGNTGSGGAGLSPSSNGPPIFHYGGMTN